MRILFCNYEYPPLGGGGGVVMAALARHLAKRHEVTVLTSRAGDLPSEAVEDGVRVLRVPVFFRRQLAVANFPSMFAYLPSGFVRALAVRRRARFDVINTHFAVPTGPLGHALARVLGVPNVLSVHGGDLFDPSKKSSPHRHAPMRMTVRALLHAADAVVGQSQDTLRHVETLYGVRRPVELVPLGIERPTVAVAGTISELRASFGLPARAFVLVTIGRLVARKATSRLVDILAATRLPDAHLLIVGSGPDAAEIADRARTLGVSNRVHLLGQLSEERKHAALRASDVFVSTSQHEGFGLVFLEAMAFGLPVVCYDRGGQTDFMRSGETGFTLPLNDEAAFKDALLALHADPTARRRQGAGNLERVEQFFIDTCAARYEQIFEGVIAKGVHSPQARTPVSSSS